VDDTSYKFHFSKLQNCNQSKPFVHNSYIIIVCENNEPVLCNGLTDTDLATVTDSTLSYSASTNDHG
jgi:hypothetical protein